MTVLAHAGHWFISILYLAPVLIVVGALWWQSRREGEEFDDEDEFDDDRNGEDAEAVL